MSRPEFCVTDYIFDAQASNFKQLALDNSELGPVLVNFWSRKAGPSFRLYPVLEKLVESYRGSFLLINVDADENRPLTREYAITSVPTLKLLEKGKVAQTLFGYQNEQDLRFMLDQYVASENDVIIHRALTLFDQGETESAYQQLGQAALKSPHYYKLPLTIAAMMKTEGRFSDATRLLRALPETAKQKPACQRLLIQCEFAEIAAPVQNARDLEQFIQHNRQELGAVSLLAAWHVTQQEYLAALKLYEHIMHTDRSFEDDLGRRCILKILTLLDEQDPLIPTYRALIRKLSN